MRYEFRMLLIGAILLVVVLAAVNSGGDIQIAFTVLSCIIGLALVSELMTGDDR